MIISLTERGKQDKTRVESLARQCRTRFLKSSRFPQVILCSNMMHFKMMSFVFKMMNFVLKIALPTVRQGHELRRATLH